ncbi:hypothetical protein IVA88_17395 [Bradyrhizobium sp. 149]|uniref:hypothetical protein n=1 Tax=Bradyrhizobium sp. 149 TaxID=2782624 RepID=UPI001FF7134B|nr:hypothetical protein [Bradyrhizobium sp. 149]MCK1653196.1 hypothetical protein [Bradyrhizobium sp. 149]
MPDKSTRERIDKAEAPRGSPAVLAREASHPGNLALHGNGDTKHAIDIRPTIEVTAWIVRSTDASRCGAADHEQSICQPFRRTDIFVVRENTEKISGPHRPHREHQTRMMEPLSTRFAEPSRAHLRLRRARSSSSFKQHNEDNFVFFKHEKLKVAWKR